MTCKKTRDVQAQPDCDLYRLVLLCETLDRNLFLLQSLTPNPTLRYCDRSDESEDSDDEDEHEDEV